MTADTLTLFIIKHGEVGLTSGGGVILGVFIGLLMLLVFNAYSRND